MAADEMKMCHLETEGWEAIRLHLRSLQEEEAERNGWVKEVICRDEGAFWGLFGGLIFLVVFATYWASIGRYYKCGCGKRGKKGVKGKKEKKRRRWPFRLSRVPKEESMKDLMIMENVTNEGQRHPSGTGTRPKVSGSGYIGGKYAIKRKETIIPAKEEIR